MIILYLFALLTMPTDRIICDLWTRALTQEAFVQACPGVPVNDLRADVYTLEMDLLCSRPAILLGRIEAECELQGPLDQYIIRIVKPAQQDLLCIVESEHQNTPAPEEIIVQCPGIPNAYSIKPIGTREVKPAESFCPMREIEPGAGLYQQPTSPAELATDEVLPLLAGELIWFGYVDVNCEGMSGVTPAHTPTPCGLAAAGAAVVAWQNQFDIAIYNAAITHHIPARLLKRIMLVESQFWIYYNRGADGEIGAMQVTDNGLDTLLRFDPWLDPTYASKSDDAQAWARAAARQYFHAESVQSINDNMTYYARLLAAYHCRAVTVNPALYGADAWRIAVINYNGAPEYLLKIER